MINRRSQHNSQSGFTIIETLVAIFILLISITGPLSFAQSGLRASFDARDQVVAFYLAQDAIESIKNIRDNDSLNPLNTGGWLASLESVGCVSDNGGGNLNQACEIQTLDGGTANIEFRNCSGSPGMCPPMRYHTGDSEYRLSDDLSGTVPSKFSRTVYIHQLTANEVQIIVMVTWNTSFFAEKRVVVQENIYNWVPVYDGI